MTEVQQEEERKVEEARRKKQQEVTVRVWRVWEAQLFHPGTSPRGPSATSDPLDQVLGLHLLIVFTSGSAWQWDPCHSAGSNGFYLKLDGVLILLFVHLSPHWLVGL